MEAVVLHTILFFRNTLQVDIEYAKFIDGVDLFIVLLFGGVLYTKSLLATKELYM